MSIKGETMLQDIMSAALNPAIQSITPNGTIAQGVLKENLACSEVAKSDKVIEGIWCVASITMKSELFIMINADGGPSLRRKNSLQPSIKGRNDQQMARRFLGNAPPASQIECTNIEVMRQTRMTVKNTPARHRNRMVE